MKMMKNIVLPVFCVISIMEMVMAAPVSSSARILLIPASAFQNIPYGQTRGPFDFIGNWIQSSSFFPIEVNVPDAFQSVGNGVGTVASNVGNFAQGVGSNIQGLAHTVGSGVQNFAQNLVQRVPVLGAFVRPTKTGQKYFIVVADGQNVGEIGDGSKGGSAVSGVSMNDLESEVFDVFP